MLQKIIAKLKYILGLTKDIDYTDCIKMGMKVGTNVHQLNEVFIDYSHCWLIEIGDNVVFGPQAYLLAHDASTKRALDYTKIGKLKIGNNTFVGARAIIMPGVHIGNNCIVAAGSVVTKSVPDNSIIGGNPAKIIGDTNAYIEKHKTLLKTAKVYDETWTISQGITEDKRKQMNVDLENAIAI